MKILHQLINLMVNKIEIVFLIIGIVFIWNHISKKKKKEEYAKQALKKALQNDAAEPLTLHPEVDPKLCAGCGACTRVCPEGDILSLINHKAVLVSPTKCVGHGECERACPFDAIKLIFGTKTRGHDIPRLNSNYETNVPGLYIAGELGGMGLIRNAIKQGVLATQDAIQKLKSNLPAQYDVIVVGAGPAGLASTLACIAAKKTYLCIEQNSFGGSVSNFPRQKIVMTAPAQLPIFGEMKFSKGKVSKEDLLEFWQDIRKKAGVKIQENTTFKNLENSDGVFRVTTDTGIFTSRKVILSLGVRGSPRKLGLANEDLPKVTYNLLDPSQYQDKDLAVVGGGNAAVEAAQYLAKAQYKNRVTLLVRGKDLDRCNDENRRIIYEMKQKSMLQILFETHVSKIEAEQINVTYKAQAINLKNDYLFVFAGTESPHKFLMGLGIQIEKKFGEALAKVKP